jgi:hypothetical protein
MSGNELNEKALEDALDACPLNYFQRIRVDGLNSQLVRCGIRSDDLRAIVTAYLQSAALLPTPKPELTEGVDDFDDYVIPDKQIIAELRTIERTFVSDGQRIAAAVCRDAASRLSALSPQPASTDPVGYCVWISPTKLAACAKSMRNSFPVYASPQPVTKPAPVQRSGGSDDLQDHFSQSIINQMGQTQVPVLMTPTPATRDNPAVTKPAMGEGWMPIETAPKDGTEFIGWDGRRPFRCKNTKHYVKWPHEEGGPTFRDVWSGDYYDSVMPENPTHWMPLPAPPATGGEEL